MKRESVFLMVFLMLPVVSSFTALEVPRVEASGVIYIKADGSIDPPTAPISTMDNVTYILTGNITSIFNGIYVGRDDIVVDGSGFAVEGPGEYGSGIYLYGRSNVTIKNTNIKNFSGGVWLSESSNNSISGNNIINNANYGVILESSSNNSISGNTVTSNYFGIMSSESSNNSISGNKITNSPLAGIWLDPSSNNNCISGNNITDNFFGIRLISSSNNTVYHNNLFNNTGQADSMAYVNFWDVGYPSGGNYWSDYNGTDANHDGIGDTPYVINTNNTDNYPLMGTFHEFTVTDGMLYNIATVSNFTILDLESVHELRLDGSWYLVLEITAVIPKGTVGFCRIDIPRVLIDGPYHVFTLGGNFTPTELPISNSSHALLYFTFDHSGPVIIVPEFPSFLILPLFFMATLLAVVTYRRKHH
jgi:parallel beta-helix repeat protein